MFCIHTKYYSGEIEECKMGWTYGTRGKEEKFLQGVVVIVWRRETAWMTWA